jgi:hypothetical protein
VYGVQELYGVLPNGAIKPLHTCHENEGGWNEEVYFYYIPLIRGVFLEFSWALTRITSHNEPGGHKRSIFTFTMVPDGLKDNLF